MKPGSAVRSALQHALLWSITSSYSASWLNNNLYLIFNDFLDFPILRNCASNRWQRWKRVRGTLRRSSGRNSRSVLSPRLKFASLNSKQLLLSTLNKFSFDLPCLTSLTLVCWTYWNFQIVLSIDSKIVLSVHRQPIIQQYSSIVVFIQVLKQPWPGMLRTVYGNHARFESVYFKKFPGYYYTGDGKMHEKLLD
jgi:hypothetical protein